MLCGVVIHSRSFHYEYRIELHVIRFEIYLGYEIIESAILIINILCIKGKIMHSTFRRNFVVHCAFIARW